MKIYTKEDLFSQLDALGARRDGIVLVHSSLRAVGPFEGGYQAFLDGLISYFTDLGGLLVIPCHTWHRLGEEITLDMASGDNCLGALSTLAAEDGRGLRTDSPTHSVVIFGDRVRAEKFADGEKDALTPTGKDTCYGRLYEEGGQVLLLGVGHNRNTYLHAVDEILGIENRMEKEKTTPVAVKYPDGRMEKREIYLFHTDYTEDISDRFVKYEIPFRYHRCSKFGFVGNAPSQLCDAGRMKEIMEKIYKNCPFDPLDTENPIEAKYYI